MSYIVIQCPQCSQKYRADPSQLGGNAYCQKCRHSFIAVDPNSQIPPEFDDSIPSNPVSPSSPPPESNDLSRQTANRLEAQRLASEIQSKSSARVTGRLLFWGGAALVVLALSLKTSNGEFHNLAKAANQLMLVICGIASMICGAAFLSREELTIGERVGVGLWLAWVGFCLAVPLMVSK